MRKLEYKPILEKITNDYLIEIIENATEELRRKELKTLSSKCEECGPFGPPTIKISC